MLVINLKSYIETIGKRGLELLEAAEKVSEEYNIDIGIAPQFTDIYLLSRNAKESKNICTTYRSN